MLEPGAKQAGGAGAAALGHGHPLRCTARLPITPSHARDPSSLPERPSTWEGPPASTACVSAASAPVTGVARRRGRGCGAAGSRLAARPRRPGSDDTKKQWPRRPSHSRFKPLLTLTSPKPAALPSRWEGPGQHPRREGGSAGAGRWAPVAGVGGALSAAGAGGGGEGGNAKSWGLLGASATSPGADPMRAHVPGNRDFPPETGGPPSPSGSPFQGVPALLELKACQGKRIGSCGCGEEAVRRGPCRAGLALASPWGRTARHRARLCGTPGRTQAGGAFAREAVPAPSWCEKAAEGLKGSSGVHVGVGAAPAAAILQVWLATGLSQAVEWGSQEWGSQEWGRCGACGAGCGMGQGQGSGLPLH
nr:spidroin-1-like [Gorilla gorilla gorilla]